MDDTPSTPTTPLNTALQPHNTVTGDAFPGWGERGRWQSEEALSIEVTGPDTADSETSAPEATSTKPKSYFKNHITPGTALEASKAPDAYLSWV